MTEIYDGLSAEEIFLLQIAKDYSRGSITTGGEGLDYTELARIAQLHQLSVIVYQQCKQVSECSAFRSAYYNTVILSEKRRKLYDSVIQSFMENGIDYIPYKGIILADYYPKPSHRSMGDVDIVVSDLEMAISVMNDLGFYGKRNREEWGGKKDGIEFELHRKFFCNSVSLNKAQNEFFEHYKNNVTEHRLDINFHFLLVISHIMKHIKNGQGVGLRQFLDVAFMIRKEENLNWKCILENAETIGLQRFLTVVLSFVNRIFDVPIPSNTEEISEDVLKTLLAHIIKDGSFKCNGVDKKLTQNVSGTLRKKRISMIFPPLNSMAELYVYLKKFPILLPVAWSYRILKRLFSCKHSENIKFSKAEIENRRKYLSDLGIN